MILHILRKDVRRLWPAIAVSLIVLGSLAWHDRNRSDQMVGEIESYLNMLVPLGWACLLALVVEQEPIPGERQFWITRPYRRSELLLEKLAFAALFVHLPSFLADCYILQSRGFPPLAYAGELLTKQLVLAGALTLPAMALASLVRSFSHFVLELVGLAAAVVLLGVAYWVPQADWEVFETVRREAVMLVAALASATVLTFQYLGRRVMLSRGIAIAGGMAIAVLVCLFVPQSALAIRSSMKPAGAALSIGVAPASGTGSGGWASRYILFIPVQLSGVPAGTHAGVMALRSRIAAQGGAYEQALHVAGRQPFERRPYFLGFTGLSWEERTPKRMMINLDPAVGGRLMDRSVTVSGEAAVTLYRTRQPVWMGASETRDFAGLGRCTTQTVERRFSESALKVECESPRHDAAGADIRLWNARTGREWKHSFWMSRSLSGSSRVSWLSPLHRSVVYVDLVPDGSRLVYELRVPRELIPDSRVEITALETVGYESMRFEFRDLDLRKYVVQQPKPASEQ